MVGSYTAMILGKRVILPTNLTAVLFLCLAQRRVFANHYFLQYPWQYFLITFGFLYGIPYGVNAT